MLRATTSRILSQRATCEAQHLHRRGTLPLLRSFATTSSTASSNLVNIRLYRILQRECLQLRRVLAANGQDTLLLQPQLDHDGAGGSRVLDNITESTDRSILRLFSLWVDKDEDDDDDDDNDDDDDDQVADWFESLSPDKEEHELEDVWDGDFDTQWSTVSTVQQAIRYAMRNTPPDPTNQRLHQQLAIRAFQLLQEQKSMYQLSSTCTEQGVRVTAVSRCIGRTITAGRAGPTELKYRFAYRVRIENVHSNHEAIQLLGRTWNIQEQNESGQAVGDPVRVHAPQTGAVGKLPVLKPGQAFEYMSGCELATTTGVMQGCFHLCRVPPETPTAHVGMRVEAFDSPDRFEVGVASFRLMVDPEGAFFSIEDTNQ